MISLRVNGQPQTYHGDPSRSLLSWLRHDLGILSPKDGCSGQAACGACLVEVDAKACLACSTPMSKLEGTRVVTIEGFPEPLRRTLTWDQGREMARHAELAELCGIDIFFAEPHSPWQRPTNENGNCLVRRYVGKSTDLALYSPDDLRAIEHRINPIPRRSLGWETAHDR